MDVADGGDEVVITERGVPDAGASWDSPSLERLTAEGVIGRPTNPDRPPAAGQ
jgi:hypothetical protein